MRKCHACRRRIVGRKQRPTENALALCTACVRTPGRGYQRKQRVPFFFQLELFAELPVFAEDIKEAA